MGTLTSTQPAGSWAYYRFDVPVMPRLPGMHVVLSHTGTGNPDLFIKSNALPTTAISDKSSQNQLVDTLLFTDTELVPGASYYIGVFLAGNEAGPATYTLSVEGYGITTLTWDDGATHAGTAMQPQPSIVGGKYFFKITTQNTTVGEWRTALNVSADSTAYLHLKHAPFTDTINSYTFHSTRTGSNGFVLHSSQFAAAQDWFIIVDAVPGSTWTLITGEAYVQPLGTLTDNGGSGSGVVNIGAEGMHFFKTTTTADTLAWCLWLNGATNDILIKKSAVPHPLSTGTYDLKQGGQMLVVPSYLVGGDQYFVGVPGAPNAPINLDSRKVVVGNLAFNTATNLTVTGCPYQVFRVQVPVNQIAWDVKTVALTAFTTNTTGNGDMWLAGMPNGSTASGTDTAPASSPGLAGLSLAPGIALSFSASGGVTNDPGSPIDPPDGGAFGNHLAGAQNGISDIVAPINAALGVFLGLNQPDLTPAPSRLDFSPMGNVPGGVDYTTLAPALKQVFFIGDGQTSGGQKQRVIVPPGATRLYLGTMDSFEWTNNHGNLTIHAFSETSERGLAVRRDFVPNEWNNDAFTEQTGSDDEGVTLVPPKLSDGTFFITVYGNTPYTCTLFNGDPLIRNVDYVSKTANIDLKRISWAYFVVTNVVLQLGSLGWDLILSNAPAGSELAIRRKFVPGQWNYRNGSPNIGTRGYVDLSSTAGFLQQPGHQADIWYVGVYNPNVALGPFLLCLAERFAPPLNIDASTTPPGTLPAGRWQFFRVEVPADVLGWDVRLTGAITGQPRPVVCHGALPTSLGTGPWVFAQNAVNWPNGYQWAAGDDWTTRPFDATGTVDERNRILAMSMERPLEAGTYYVGVNNSSSAPMTDTVQSRGIGTGHAIPVTTLTSSAPGNAITVNNLPPREAAYFHIVSTPGPGWKLRLNADSGEALMSVASRVLPNVLPGIDANGATTSGQRVRKAGNEHFT